eukprot:TRINITY_DN578_c0_g1_i2.p1 TRINITY_DN578_c0_g1~~TRINITY_DN578_c0_g1_i2.p1  ORF type:complete len:430 (-),score=47.00 TRINITY_DN578_c0_g1_i2:373-1662(-)
MIGYCGARAEVCSWRSVQRNPENLRQHIVPQACCPRRLSGGACASRSTCKAGRRRSQEHLLLQVNHHMAQAPASGLDACGCRVGEEGWSSRRGRCHRASYTEPHEAARCQGDVSCSEADTNRYYPDLGGCCIGLGLCSEPRPTSDPAYCAEDDPKHGFWCWSEITMCRETCTSLPQSSTTISIATTATTETRGTTTSSTTLFEVPSTSMATSIPPEVVGEEPPCLCVFDIDRTLTGRQGDTTNCPHNRVAHPRMRDGGYDGGDVTLSAFAAEGVSNTFCRSCYLGICSAGQGSGAGSAWNNYILDDIMRNALQDNLTKALPSTRSWSYGEQVVSPYVLSQGNRIKQNAVEGIRQWYQRQGIDVEASNVFFFGDRTENIEPFQSKGFNSREVSCDSRDHNPRWYHGSGMIGYCGARAEEIQKTSGNILCK